MCVADFHPRAHMRVFLFVEYKDTQNMANEIQIFSNPQFGEIEAVEQKFADIKSKGWVYALEYGDKVKIGCSSNPSHRYAHLIHNGADYAGLKMGRFALSKACVNFRRMESDLHKRFAQYRKEGTELFSLPFDRIVSTFSKLDYDFNFRKADETVRETQENGYERLVGMFGGEVMPNSKVITADDVDCLLKFMLNLIEEQRSLIKNQLKLIDKSMYQTRYYRRIAEHLCGCQLGVIPMEELNEV